MSLHFKSLLAATLAIGLGAGLSACVTETPYAPAAYRGAQGYFETQLENDRFRVNFAGNTSTPREVVENYLLYRAAELTVQQGYDWFEMAGRNTRRETETFTTRDPPMGYYVPVTRWYGLNDYRTYLIWQPIYGTGGVRRDTYESFTAGAEILLRRGAKPPGDALAFNAREVMANLGPTLRRPEGG